MATVPTSPSLLRWPELSDARAAGCESAGAFAAVLMRTDTSFTLGQLKAALRLSFQTVSFVRLDQDRAPNALPPSTDAARSGTQSNTVGEDEGKQREGEQGAECRADANGWELHCDLDGVLCDFDAGVKALLPGAEMASINTKKARTPPAPLPVLKSRLDDADTRRAPCSDGECWGDC
jgi:hypothetical protein